MNTLEIQNYLKKIHHALAFNVFAANRIPMIITPPVYMISNLDPDTKPGSHWIAIFIDCNGVGEYFDTFGRKPEGYHLSFLKRNARRWCYNNKAVQSVFSTVCGEYCLLYLYFKFRGMTLTNFVQIFNKDPFSNDVILNDMFKTYI